MVKSVGRTGLMFNKNKARRPMLQTIGKFVPCPNEILMRNKTV